MNRTEIETRFATKLTDRQWNILLQEVEGKEEWELEAQVVEEVMTNLESFEREHDWWESLNK